MSERQPAAAGQVTAEQVTAEQVTAEQAGGAVRWSRPGGRGRRRGRQRGLAVKCLFCVLLVAVILALRVYFFG